MLKFVEYYNWNILIHSNVYADVSIASHMLRAVRSVLYGVSNRGPGQGHEYAGAMGPEVSHMLSYILRGIET